MAHRNSVKIQASPLRLATERYMGGQGGFEEYVKELQKSINTRIDAPTEYERGVQEGMRRAHIDLIQTYEKVR
jgi:hypothetical protein